MLSRFSAAIAMAALTGVSASTLAFAQDAFPVTIEHALGEATIEAKPQRIVTIGWMSQDTVLALGEVPAGIPYTAWGGDNEGYYPWVRAKLDELGQGYPAQLDYADGIPFEDILALDPDLIVARYSGLTDEEYSRLASVAPTIAYAGEPWSGEWRDVVRTVGKAMGESERAEALVAETDAKIDQTKAEHPEFAGRTFAFAGGLGEGTAQVAFYVSTDPRVQLVQDLGLTLAEGVQALPTDQGFNVPISLENLDTMDADIFIAWHPDQAGADYVRSNDLFSRYRPVSEDHFIPIIDRSFVMATSAPSPLSIPYAIETLVPEIAAVLK